MVTLLIFLLALAAGALFLWVLRAVLASERLRRTNYRGSEVPTSAGILFIPTILVVWIASQIYLLGNRQAWAIQAKPGYGSLGPGMNTMLVLVLGMCATGLIDDLAGDGSARGFKGHLSEAMRGSLTSGLLKALLGYLVALAALLPVLLTYRTPWQSYGKWFLDAAVIALAANFFNLLDVRPGRSLKVFFPALGLCVGLTVRYELITPGTVPVMPVSFYLAPALAVTAVALVLFPGDLRERFMMGDAGSNVIGAAIGLGLVLGLPFWWRLGALAVLLVLNLISEKISYTEFIAGNRALNWLDSLGRKG